MFAIIRSGGKQYKVEKNDKIEVAKMDAKEGDQINIDDVMFVGGEKDSKFGDALKGAKIVAKVLRHTRGDKITVFKKKRRQNYRRKAGHRQDYTLIQITDIKAA